jgi:hypothetical protein
LIVNSIGQNHCAAVLGSHCIDTFSPFSNRSDVLRLERDIGLGHRLPLLKDLFIREAAGLTGEVPKLLRGEAL